MTYLYILVNLPEVKCFGQSRTSGYVFNYSIFGSSVPGYLVEFVRTNPLKTCQLYHMST